jgi:uncharacterized protein YecA (UPF0149 family)
MEVVYHLFQELLVTQQFPTHQELLHLFSNHAIVMDTLEIHQHSSNCLCQFYLDKAVLASYYHKLLDLLFLMFFQLTYHDYTADLYIYAPQM